MPLFQGQLINALKCWEDVTLKYDYRDIVISCYYSLIAKGWEGHRSSLNYTVAAFDEVTNSR